MTLNVDLNPGRLDFELFNIFDVGIYFEASHRSKENMNRSVQQTEQKTRMNITAVEIIAREQGSVSSLETYQQITHISLMH
jgi:hypothetical protein